MVSTSSAGPPSENALLSLVWWAALVLPVFGLVYSGIST